MFNVQDINLEDEIKDKQSVDKPLLIKTTLQLIRSKIIGPQGKLRGL